MRSKKKKKKLFVLAKFSQATNCRALSSNCTVLICPNEKKVPEFEQTKARGERALAEQITKHHLIQPLVSFPLFSCQHSHTSVVQHDKLIKYHGNRGEPGSHLRPYGGWDRAKLFYSLRFVLFLISHQVASCRPPELLSSCSNMILAMLVICRTIGLTRDVKKGQGAEVLVRCPVLKLIHRRP